MSERLEPQVVFCCKCGKEITRGKVEPGEYLDQPPCKKKACEDADIFVLTGR